MPNKAEVWACDFCYTDKLTITKSGMRKHEKKCGHNPVNKACFTCKHQGFEEGEDAAWDEPDYCSIPRGYYCELGPSRGA